MVQGLYPLEHNLPDLLVRLEMQLMVQENVLIVLVKMRRQRFRLRDSETYLHPPDEFLDILRSLQVAIRHQPPFISTCQYHTTTQIV